MIFDKMTAVYSGDQIISPHTRDVNTASNEPKLFHSFNYCGLCLMYLFTHHDIKRILCIIIILASFNISAFQIQEKEFQTVECHPYHNHKGLCKFGFICLAKTVHLIIHWDIIMCSKYEMFLLVNDL